MLTFHPWWTSEQSFIFHFHGIRDICVPTTSAIKSLLNPKCAKTQNKCVLNLQSVKQKTYKWQTNRQRYNECFKKQQQSNPFNSNYSLWNLQGWSSLLIGDFNLRLEKGWGSKALKWHLLHAYTTFPVDKWQAFLVSVHVLCTWAAIVCVYVCVCLKNHITKNCPDELGSYSPPLPFQAQVSIYISMEFTSRIDLMVWLTDILCI